MICKRTKRKRIQTPYPESKDTQKNLVDEVRGSKGRQNNAGGAGISFSFSSVPRRRLIWGAGWWWGARAEGLRQSCSFSWAGARCTEGCCSSWCTLSSVSLGSRTTDTPPRQWGRPPRMHTTSGTWSLQHRPTGAGLTCAGRQIGPSEPFLPPLTAQTLGRPKGYFWSFRWAPLNTGDMW